MIRNKFTSNTSVYSTGWGKERIQTSRKGEYFNCFFQKAVCKIQQKLVCSFDDFSSLPTTKEPHEVRWSLHPQKGNYVIFWPIVLVCPSSNFGFWLPFMVSSCSSDQQHTFFTVKTECILFETKWNLIKTINDFQNNCNGHLIKLWCIIKYFGFDID